MMTELAAAGIDADVVAINIVSAESTQEQLASRCSFDLLQDVLETQAWSLMGGGKDDIFIYRAGGRLAPNGYLPTFGEVDTNLSTPEGYQNVLEAIKAAHALGPARPCTGGPHSGLQRVGNANQDERLDLTDAVVLLSRLFVGMTDPLPCEGDSLESDANLGLHDSNGDNKVNLADAVYLLDYLFLGGPPVPGAGECRAIKGCPERCGG